MASYSLLQSAYPWTKTPLIASAPMLRIAMAPLAVSVSRAGGLGFLAGGFDVSNLERDLEHASRLINESGPKTISQSLPRDQAVLPIGVGFINWGADRDTALAALKRYTPCAVWLFAPTSQPDDLVPWAEQIRTATSGKTKIWVQVGSVTEAAAVVQALKPDVLVIQGNDAGGHGLAQSASIVTLLPEVRDSLEQLGHGDIPLVAAGGIMDGRGVAASLMLGAAGAVMGTRFLACSNATIARGYQTEILRTSDGGISTVRSTVYDRARGILNWPERYNGRGVINQTYIDSVKGGVSDSDIRDLYSEEAEKGDNGWGPHGRMTTYAGTGVGLVKEILTAEEIVNKTLSETNVLLRRHGSRL
jgi:nitronate monooxygenase